MRIPLQISNENLAQKVASERCARPRHQERFKTEFNEFVHLALWRLFLILFVDFGLKGVFFIATIRYIVKNTMKTFRHPVFNEKKKILEKPNFIYSLTSYTKDIEQQSKADDQARSWPIQIQAGKVLLYILLC